MSHFAVVEHKWVMMAVFTSYWDIESDQQEWGPVKGGYHFMKRHPYSLACMFEELETDG